MLKFILRLILLSVFAIWLGTLAGCSSTYVMTEEDRKWMEEEIERQREIEERRRENILDRR